MQNEVKVMGAKVKIKTNFDPDFPFYLKGQRCLEDKSLKIIIDKNKWKLDINSKKSFN